MLDRITPVLLTLDEMPNLPRTLGALEWARRIVVVDSGSQDGTREWLGRDPRVALFVREFDSFAGQSEFGLRETGIETEWVLSLDADHVLSPELVGELKFHEPATGTEAYSASFIYCIQGKPLRASLYPPRIVLARRSLARYLQDGHAHRLVVEGPKQRLRGSILHDDRKPRSRWLAEQVRYSAAEAQKLLSSPAGTLSFQDRLRRTGVIAPWLVPLYCLTVKRGLFSGRAGWIYAGERAVAEWMLAMALFAKRMKSDDG